jgi:hypothetical protein
MDSIGGVKRERSENARKKKRGMRSKNKKGCPTSSHSSHVLSLLSASYNVFDLRNGM